MKKHFCIVLDRERLCHAFLVRYCLSTMASGMEGALGQPFSLSSNFLGSSLPLCLSPNQFEQGVRLELYMGFEYVS